MISQAIKCLALEVSKAAMIGLAVSMFHFMTSKSRAGSQTSIEGRSTDSENTEGLDDIILDGCSSHSTQETITLSTPSPTLNSEKHVSALGRTGNDRGYHHKENRDQSGTCSSIDRLETNLELLKIDGADLANKAHDRIRVLEDQIKLLTQALQNSNHRRQSELKDKETLHHQALTRMQLLHEQQLNNLKGEWQNENLQITADTGSLEDVIREKDEQIVRMTLLHKKSGLQAEKTIESYKLQVGEAQKMLYEGMRKQVGILETEVVNCKQLIDTMQEDFKLHIEDLRDKHQDEVISGLEQQLRELREELVSANALQLQNLVELSVIHDGEQKESVDQNKSSASTQKSNTDTEQSKLRDRHSGELERHAEMANKRLRQLEKDYQKKLEKAKERLAHAEEKEADLVDQISKIQNEAREVVLRASAKLDKEQSKLKNQFSATIMSAQAELESERERNYLLQRELQKVEYVLKEQIGRVKMQYEERMRGLLPKAIQDDMEKTITSLKSQVHVLQHRLDEPPQETAAVTVSQS